MTLRQRLFIAYLTIATLVLLILGTLANQIILETNATEDTQPLEITATVLANRLIDSSINPTTLLSNEHKNSTIIVIIDSSGSLINEFKYNNNSNILSQLKNTIAMKAILRDAAGGFSLGSRQYIWAKSPIPESGKNLLLLHYKEKNTPFVETMPFRVLVTTIIIIWLAIWSVLVSSSRLSHRIEEQNKKILHQSLYDDLTKLPNRLYFIEQIKKSITTGKKDGTPFSLCVMDLNNFKEVNDTLGHSSGDSLLQQLGIRLENILCKNNTIARFGGDEFAILFPTANSHQAIASVNEIINSLNQPFKVGELDIKTSASIGISTYPKDGEDPELLIQHADVAMYQAKNNSRDYEIYTLTTDPNSIKKLTLSNDLHMAIENQEFEIYYQPKIDLKTNSVYGVEALIRWHHKKFGFIPPDDFIGLAEKTGFIKPLTEWVITNSVAQAIAWRSMGINLKISINVSMRNLYDRELPEKISTILKQHNASSDCIDLEITETAAMSDPENTLITLKELHKLGIRLSIDDFGTGSTSLSYLRDLPIDELKIDKSFVLNMCNSNNDKIIVRTIIELAHNMGRQVVAEGVETIEALEMLKFMECDMAQGYYIARPLPVSELNAWINNGKWKITA